MRTFLVRRSSPIHPFQRPVDELGVGATTFGHWRAGVLGSLRLPVADEAHDDDTVTGPALVLSDEVFFSRRALGGFVKAARAAGGLARLCLPKSRQTELFAPLQDVDTDAAGRLAYDVAWVPSGVTATVKDALSLDAARWMAPPYREWALEAPVPKYIFGREEPFTFPLTSTVVLRIRHWLHVLRASHLVPQVELLDRAYGSPVGALLRGLLALRLSRAATFSAAKRRFVYRGRRCFVHPTATVEASVLYDDVHIGPYAYVVGSVLGPGSYIEDRAHVNQSCLGPRTFVSRNSTVSACAVFGDTDACTNGIQACVIAERCGLTSFAKPLDIIPGSEVRVLDHGVARSVGEMPCGVAFGQGCFVGADVQIAPGRAIPPGIRLVAPPGTALRKIDDGALPGTGTVEDGAYLPLRG